MPKCDLCDFIEITLRHGCSPVNLLHFFRTLFLRAPLDDYFWYMSWYERRFRYSWIFNKETWYKMVFGFIKKIFVGLLSVCVIERFGPLLAFNYTERIKCVSLIYQLCQIWPTLVNISSDDTLFYPDTVSGNTNFKGSCNISDEPYAQVCVHNKVKIMNVKILNLVSLNLM